MSSTTPASGEAIRVALQGPLDDSLPVIDSAVGSEDIFCHVDQLMEQFFAQDATCESIYRTAHELSVVYDGLKDDSPEKMEIETAFFEAFFIHRNFFEKFITSLAENDESLLEMDFVLLIDAFLRASEPFKETFSCAEMNITMQYIRECLKADRHLPYDTDVFSIGIPSYADETFELLVSGGVEDGIPLSASDYVGNLISLDAIYRALPKHHPEAKILLEKKFLSFIKGHPDLIEHMRNEILSAKDIGDAPIALRILTNFQMMTIMNTFFESRKKNPFYGLFSQPIREKNGLPNYLHGIADHPKFRKAIQRYFPGT